MQNQPHKYVVLEFKYERLASVAHYYKHRIRYFIYSRLAEYYKNKNYKRLMK